MTQYIANRLVVFLCNFSGNTSLYTPQIPNYVVLCDINTCVILNVDNHTIMPTEKKNYQS